MSALLTLLPLLLLTLCAYLSLILGQACVLDAAKLYSQLSDQRITQIQFYAVGGCAMKVGCAPGSPKSAPFCEDVLLYGGSDAFYFRCANQAFQIIAGSGFRSIVASEVKYVEVGGPRPRCYFKEFNPGLYVRAGTNKRDLVEADIWNIPLEQNNTEHAMNCDLLSHNNTFCTISELNDTNVISSYKLDCLQDLNFNYGLMLSGDCNEYARVLESDCFAQLCSYDQCVVPLLSDFASAFNSSCSSTSAAIRRRPFTYPWMLLIVLLTSLLTNKNSKLLVLCVCVILVLGSLDGTLARFSSNVIEANLQVGCCNKMNACWTGNPLCGWPAACYLWETCRVQPYMIGVTIADCEGLDYECD